MRYAVKLAYDGSAFSGWQKQPGCLTVQGVLEDAFAAFCPEKVAIQGAGRTDKGVPPWDRSPILICPPVNLRKRFFWRPTHTCPVRSG